MATQIINSFIPATDGTPSRYETTVYNTNPIVTDRQQANELQAAHRRNQERIARNDAKWLAHVEACKRYERKLETFLERQPDRNPIRISAALNAWFRNNPEPKPPVLEK